MASSSSSRRTPTSRRSRRTSPAGSRSPATRPPHGGPLAGLATALDASPDDAAIATRRRRRHATPRAGVLRLLVARSRASRHRRRDPRVRPAPPPSRWRSRSASRRLAANALLAEDRRSLRALLDALHATTIPASDLARPRPDGHTLDDIDLPTDR